MRKRAEAFQVRLSMSPLAPLLLLWIAAAPEAGAQTGWKKD
jgi:hypothetical protein